MIRIEVSHLFDIPVRDTFAFITNLKNWPLYWPDFVRIEDAEYARWAAPGDRVTVVQRLIGRTVALHMELVEYRADELVRYRSRQDGLPDVDHERHFLAVPNGTHYRLVVSYAPRAGLRGLFDRVVLRRGVKRALDSTIENLRVALWWLLPRGHHDGRVTWRPGLRVPTPRGPVRCRESCGAGSISGAAQARFARGSERGARADSLKHVVADKQRSLVGAPGMIRARTA